MLGGVCALDGGSEGGERGGRGKGRRLREWLGGLAGKEPKLTGRLEPNPVLHLPPPACPCPVRLQVSCGSREDCQRRAEVLEAAVAEELVQPLANGLKLPPGS